MHGSRVAQTTAQASQGQVETLELEGPEIVRGEVAGGGGEGFLSQFCVDKRRIEIERGKARSAYYTGSVDLASAEPAGTWGVAVVSQTLDVTPTDGDPVQAAHRLGGIVDSANIVERSECSCTLLYDETFEVAQ
jgi:hypothetical protein